MAVQIRPGARKDTIEQQLADAFALAHLEVLDESHNHSVPEGAQSHFKVVLVSNDFAGQRLVARHRAVNQALQSHFAEGLHALAIHTFTESEWQDRFGAAPMSPPCLGGGDAAVPAAGIGQPE